MYISQNAALSFLRSRNSTDILWVCNDEILLNKSTHTLGHSRKEPTVAVDTYSNLYLSHVTVSDQGQYSCLVSGYPMLKLTIIVIPKSIIHTSGKILVKIT